MRLFVLRLLGLLAFALGFVAIVRGDGYADGYQQHGYTYVAKYQAWLWPATGAYYKLSYSTVQQPYYYCGQCYYRSYQQPTYTRYYPPEPVSYRDPDYLSKLGDIALQRDKAVLEILKDRARLVNYKEAVDALGLTGNFRIEGYGANLPGYPAQPYIPQSYQVGAHGAQGSTVYGYSFSQIVDLYGDNSVALGIQALGKANQGAQQTATDVAAIIGEVVDRQGDRMERFASILAKAKAVETAVKAFDENKIRIETKGHGTAAVPHGFHKQAAKLTEEGFFNLVRQDCGKCHFGDQNKGGFGINHMLKDEWRAKVWAYITEKQGCPQDAGGNFQALPPEKLEQYKLWLMGN